MSASRVKHQDEESAFFKLQRVFAPRSPNGFPIGKRTRKRAQQNRQLSKLKINHCELKLKGCLGNRYLTWAHAKKSRFLVTIKDWQRAARACLSCHDEVEKLSHEEMAKTIDAAIANRRQTER